MLSFCRLAVSACLLFALPTLTTAQAPESSGGALWVAESQALLELDRYSGAEVGRIPGTPGALAVAVDAEREVVWLLFPRQLFGHTPTTQPGEGGPPRRIQLPETVGRGARLFVLPADGSLWVTSGDRLLGFTAAGQALPVVALSSPARHLAYDGLRGILWVAVADRLVGVDPVSAAVLEEIPIDLLAAADQQLPAPPALPAPPPVDPPEPTDPGDDPTLPPLPPPDPGPEPPTNPRDPQGEPNPTPNPDPGEPQDPTDPDGRPLVVAQAMETTEVLSLAVDPETSTLWVGLTDALVKLSPEGLEELRIGLPSAALHLVDDRRGGVWMALAPSASDEPARLVRLDGDGTVGADAFPLPAGEEVAQLVRDNLAVWTVGRNQLVRLIRGGQEQRRFDLRAETPGNLKSTDPEIEGAAVSSESQDSIAPTLVYAAPLAGQELDIDIVQLAWDTADDDSGINTGSLAVTDSLGQAQPCSPVGINVLTGRMTCSLDPLDPDTYTLHAQVQDNQGNLSNLTTRTFTVLEESQIPGGGGGNPSPSPSVFSPIQPERGFEPNKAFDFQSGIDSISLSSGNLVLSIPLGQAYSVGPALAYQFRLTHNSNAWDPIKMTFDSPLCSGQGGQATCPDVLFSVPDPSSNAGLGWQVHLGRLFAPIPPTDLDNAASQLWPNRMEDPEDQTKAWLYISPDGASHTLHQLQGWDSGDSQNASEIRYSKDGSLLRMRRLGEDVIYLEEPNGLVTEFRQVLDEAGTLLCGGEFGKCWRFHEKRDRYGNYVRASYSASGTTETWTVTDSTGRIHRLFFAIGSNPLRAGGDAHPDWRLSATNADEWGDLRRVLTRVEVASFGGQTAAYDLVYSTTTLLRARPHDERNELPLEADQITVPILTRLNVPDAADYVFQTETGSPLDNGRIQAVQLPSQGTLEYDYTWWDFPTACVYTVEDNVEAFYQLRGVSKKRLKRLNGGTEGEWTYTSTLFPAISGAQESGPGCARSQYRVTTVDAPKVDGAFNRTVSYHAVNQAPTNPNQPLPITSWQVTDSGLPYSKHASHATGSNRAFLSQELKQCTGTSTSASCTTHQRTYRRYATSLRPCTQGAGRAYQASAGCYQVHPRPVIERVVYPLDGNRSVETRWSNFDAVGQARKVVRTDGLSTETTTVNTDYTATSLSLNPDANGYLSLTAPGAALPASKTWILHPFNKVTTTRDGVTYVREAQFDPNGSLLCERSLRGTSRSATDLVRSRILGSTPGINAGLPVTEILAGGDTAALSTGTLCSTPGSATTGSRFEIVHTYQHLQRASSKFNASGQPFFFRVDIDRNTGLPRTSYDIAGRTTALDFDALGRLTRLTPEAALGAADSTATYNNPTGAKPTVRVERRTTTSGAPLTSELTELDEFGRFWRLRLKRPLPAGGAEETLAATLYDAAGRVRTETTRQRISTFTAAKATRYSDFDAFDRPQRIDQPDGGVINLTYRGQRIENRTLAVRTATTGTTDVTTTRYFDADGQVVRVDNPLYTTTFAYDPNGAVIQARRKVGSSTRQTRTYARDGRGFLTAETLPEIGVDGSNPGTITYTRDALGNVRTRNDGVWLRNYAYDGGGRPTSMVAGGLLWQEWVWGTVPGNRFGKLIEARRHNYPFSFADDWAISEKYDYDGVLGALSRKTTQIQFPLNSGADRWGEAFQQTWTYTPLGNVATVGYPVCIPSPGATSRVYCNDGNDQVPAAHTSTWQYNQGLPTRVTSSRGPAADYEYHGNLTFSRIAHSNGVEDLYTEDPFGQARPHRIRIQKGSTSLYDSGTYQYDEAGNIWAIGVDRYLYDPASRLISGHMARFGPNVKEVYTYDALDNLLSLHRLTDPAPLNWRVDHKNRVRGPSTGPDDIFYDAAGSLLRIGFTHTNQPIYQMGYDALNMQTSFLRRDGNDAIQEDYRSIYGPGNVRFLVWDFATRAVTLRGLDNRPLRTYQVTGFGPGAQWDWQQDSIHGPNGILASVKNDGNPWHYHPDHLGSPKILTSQSGTYVAEHHYHPYGAEHYRFGTARPDDPNHKFTGHERDASGVTDYMLGRTYFFPLGRFGTVDPARDGWNLYGYVGGNPMGAVDPDGRERAQILLDQDNAAFLAGEITQDELMQRFEARAKGAVTGALIFTPGPEELLVASAARAIGGAVRGATTRVGGFLKRLLGKPDEASHALPKTGSAKPEFAGKRFSQKVKDQAREESNETCVFCGTKTSTEPGPTRSEIDHSIPRSRGGDNTLDNAQNTCRTCNRRKGARTTEEFLE